MLTSFIKISLCVIWGIRIAQNKVISLPKNTVHFDCHPGRLSVRPSVCPSIRFGMCVLFFFGCWKHYTLVYKRRTNRNSFVEVTSILLLFDDDCRLSTVDSRRIGRFVGRDIGVKSAVVMHLQHSILSLKQAAQAQMCMAQCASAISIQHCILFGSIKIV